MPEILARITVQFLYIDSDGKYTVPEPLVFNNPKNVQYSAELKIVGATDDGYIKREPTGVRSVFVSGKVCQETGGL